MQPELPNITVIIPTYNEEDFIIKCLDSIIEGKYPLEKLEILIADGMSTDNTRSLVQSLTREYEQIRLIDNPKKIVPAAMNTAIAQASHEIIVWLGAHAVYHCDYLVQSVTILVEQNCASVGGIIKPVANTEMGKAIALATTSKFGIGNAQYRHAAKRQEVESVFGGCWFKSSVLKVGGFNEGWVRNQDLELNIRLREEIGPIILDPSIRCDYFCRESIPDLAKQYFNYGKGRALTVLEHPSSFSSRLAAPIGLVVGLVLSLFVAFAGSSVSLILPAIYLSACVLVSSIYAVRENKPKYTLILPVIFATLHLCWGAGFIQNMINRLVTGKA